MKRIYLFLYTFIVLFFISCNEEKLPIEKLGEVKYYDSFWPCPADTTSLTKTFIFDFNADAKAKGDKAFAEFAFVDLKGNPIPTKELRIEKDGEVLDQNRFKVTAVQPEASLKFTYLPAAKSGTHQGMLRLVSSGGIERICSSEIAADQQLDLFKWDIKFIKSWNPLAFRLFWLFVFIVLLLLIWLCLIKSRVFPTIKLNSIDIVCKDVRYFDSIKIYGYRKVICCNQGSSQSIFNRIFTGRILYIVNDVWQDPWTIEQYKKTTHIDLNGNYIIKPYTSEVGPNEKPYSIINKNKQEIKVKFN